MKPLHLLAAILSFVVAASVHAQGLPPLGGLEASKPAGTSASGSLSVDAANADLKTARTANAEKRYADAETLMRRDTTARPDLVYLWVELGLSQLGQKKYDEAEASFKSAMANNGGNEKTKAVEGFFTADGRGTRSGNSISEQPTGTAKRLPEIDGISKSSLGEIYIRTGKVAEAKAAFDQAAAAYPQQAPLYYRNEAVFFLQAGNAVEQVAAAEKAIAIDPTRAALYFYKGQGLAAQASVDAKTQKLILPAGCAEALQKYLDLEPTGQYAPDTKALLAAAGITPKPAKK